MPNLSGLGPYVLVTPQNDGAILMFGPPSDEEPGAVVFEFNASSDFVGSFAVLGHVTGPAVPANAPAHPAMPVPYRRINVGGAASDYAMVSDLIANTGMIQVPANGMSIGLGVSCSAGTCSIWRLPVEGASSV